MHVSRGACYLLFLLFALSVEAKSEEKPEVILERIRKFSPYTYGMFTDNFRDELLSKVSWVSDDGNELHIEVPLGTDPRFFLEREFVIFREDAYIVRVKSDAVNTIGIKCSLLVVSMNEKGLIPKVGDSALSKEKSVK